MKPQEKAKEICFCDNCDINKWCWGKMRNPPCLKYKAVVQALQWKDKQFAVLLRTELATWQGNSAEAKYRREMLKELLNQFK